MRQFYSLAGRLTPDQMNPGEAFRYGVVNSDANPFVVILAVNGPDRAGRWEIRFRYEEDRLNVPQRAFIWPDGTGVSK